MARAKSEVSAKKGMAKPWLLCGSFFLFSVFFMKKTSGAIAPKEEVGWEKERDRKGKSCRGVGLSVRKDGKRLSDVVVCWK